jgi:hypothetical protein
MTDCANARRDCYTVHYLLDAQHHRRPAVGVCARAHTHTHASIRRFGVICSRSSTDSLKYMRMTFAALAYTQSCLNPIVYAFVSRGFRQSFGDAVHGWCRKRQRAASAGSCAVATARLERQSTRTRVPTTSSMLVTGERRPSAQCTVHTTTEQDVITSDSLHVINV